MQVIVGLGNPGSEYEGTRHNIGFAVVDALAKKLDLTFHPGRGEYLLASSKRYEEEIVLVKPLTYMNNSGMAVKEIVERYDVLLEQLLVIVDDFHLPLGSLRLRLKGSDGGHNGLASIIYQLESDAFPRLRCGIKSELMPKKKKEMTSFVLAPFEHEEQEHVRTMINQARDAAIVTETQGLQAAMNRFNIVQV